MYSRYILLSALLVAGTGAYANNIKVGEESQTQNMVLQDFVWVVGNLRKKHYLCSRYENNRRNT